MPYSRSLEVLYRYRCGLEQGVSFTHYIRTRTERKYFCINYPERGIARLKEYLARSPQLAYREYFLITLAVDEALRAWQNTISDRRAKLLDMVRVDLMHVRIAGLTLCRNNERYSSNSMSQR